MNPYYQDDAVTLYHGDALDVLPEFAGQPRFNAVITDPPYIIGSLSAGTLTSKSGTWADMMNSTLWFTHWYTQTWSLIRDDGCMWTFMNWRSLPVCLKAAHDAQFSFVSMLVWDKEWIGPGGPQGLRPSYELIGLAAKPSFQVPNRGVPDIQRHKTGSHKPNGHPAEKPEGLIHRLIEITSLEPGAIVLDPFAGSGTTGVAAKRAGLSAVLIEQDERYCEIIARRLAQGVLL